MIGSVSMRISADTVAAVGRADGFEWVRVSEAGPTELAIHTAPGTAQALADAINLAAAARRPTPLRAVST